MRLSFSEQLRWAILNCGVSRYRLAKQLDIEQSTLSRFLSGERGISLKAVDKLEFQESNQLVARTKDSR